MVVSDRRLTGRDVLAKTFHAKTKRGYDPVEVDAYLELVAAQIDVLHGDIANVGEQQAQALAPAPVAVPSPELEAELEQLRQLNAELSSELSQEQAVSESLRVENEQLRVQLTAVAPPPPAMDPIPEPEVVVEATPQVAVETIPAAPVDGDVVVNDRGQEESYELVLRMAHRTAEDTISQAHARADEIVAEAQFNAAQISKESDRKAFEAANRVQAEIASLSTEIETRRSELVELQQHTQGKKDELRGLANNILTLANGHAQPAEGNEVVDLRPQTDGDPSDLQG